MDQLNSIGQSKEKKKSYSNLFHFESRMSCSYCPKDLREIYFKLDHKIKLDICDRCQGVFLNVGIKFPYFIFFGKDRSIESKEANIPMLMSMGILASLCIYLGCFPQKLYELLPYSSEVFKVMPSTFSDIYVKHFDYVITKIQWLSLTTLAFFLFFSKVKKTNTITIDFDWIYRRLLRYIYIFMVAFIDFIYNLVNKITMSIISNLSDFFRQSIPYILYILNVPYLRISNVKINKFQLINEYSNSVKKQAFPFTVLGSFVFILIYIIV